MASVTLETMRRVVRELCAQETQAPTTAFVEDTPELDGYINSWLSDLRDLLIEVQGQEWASRTHSFALVSGQDEYSLPPDFDELLGVRIDQGGEHTPLDPWDYADLARLESQTALATPSEWRYRLKGEAGDLLSIKPTPTTTDTVYVDYVPAYRTLTATTQPSYTMPAYAWRWAALGAAIDCVNKADLDPAALETRLRQKEALIRRKGARRDRRAPKIKDTRRDGERLLRRAYPRLWTST